MDLPANLPIAPSPTAPSLPQMSSGLNSSAVTSTTPLPQINDKRHSMSSDAIALIDPNHLYSIGEAAQLLKISIDTLRRWEEKGLIKAVRTQGNLRRFSGKELQQYIKEALNQDTLLSISEAAHELGVSIQTLRRWDKSGKLQAERAADGSRAYHRKDLQHVFAGTTTQQPQQPALAQPVQMQPKQDQPKPTQTTQTPIEQAKTSASPTNDKEQTFITDDKRHEPESQTITAEIRKPDQSPIDMKAIALENPEKPLTEAKSSVDAAAFATHDQFDKLNKQLDRLTDKTGELDHKINIIDQRNQTIKEGKKHSALQIPLRGSASTITAAQFDNAGNLVSPQVDDHADNIVGTATLPAGSAKVVVKTTAVTKNALIFVTPLSQVAMPLCVPIAISGEGFAVTIASSVSYDIAFNWLIIDTYRDQQAQ